MRFPRAVWVQNPGPAFIVPCLFRSLFADLEIYYDEHKVTPFQLRLLGLIGKPPFRGRCRPAMLSFDRADSDSECLAYGIREKVEECLEAICRAFALASDPRRKNMVKCFLYDSIYKRVAFIEMVRNRYARLFPGGEYVGEIFLKKHSLNVFIAAAYESYPLAVKTAGMRDERIGIALRLLAYLPFIIFGKLLYRGAQTNVSSFRPSVWVEFEDQSGLDFSFWRDHLDQDRAEIVHFLFRGDTPADSHTVRILEGRGFKWVDAHFLPALRMSGVGYKEVGGAVRKLGQDLQSYSLLIAYLFFLYNINYLVYSALFRKFQVRIMIQHHDTLWMQELWARALEAAGGVLIGFHWSNYPAVMPQNHLFPFHVFFVWGEGISRFIAPGGHTTDFILPSGLWLNDRRDSAAAEAFPGSIDFVLALFDSSAAYNLHQTDETLSMFYLRMLELLDKRSSWGMIVKSKNWRAEEMGTLHRGNLIVEKMHRLAATGRLQILPPDASPLTAAARADLSVCYGLNSAGIVCAVHGHRVVHWDCSRWHRHPFYQDPYQQFIFQRLDDLERSIIRAAAGDETVGDFSRWRRAYNHFDDHDAARRVGRFMTDLTAFLDDNDEVRTALRRAAKKYIRENDVGPPFAGADAGNAVGTE